MDSKVSLLIDRAENELLTSQALKKISENDTLKKDIELPLSTTFYSSVIAHAYYSIFYVAKAALSNINVEIGAPNVHKKAFVQFKKHFIDTNLLDKHLLELYEDAKVKAEDLLQIMEDEKKKRGNFTYRTFPQANKEPAEESLKNANNFIIHIKAFIQKKK